MRAYNHFIVSEAFGTENEKKRDESFLFLKRKINISFDEFQEKIEFHNNQKREITLFSDQKIGVTQKGQRWIFFVKDVIAFEWQHGSSDIFYDEGKEFSKELLKYWFLHTLLPIYLTIEKNYYFLHAGAVEIDGRGVLFIAPSYGGKSTLTDYFIRRGHPLISDDKVATFDREDIFFAISSYPYHRPYRKCEDLGFPVEKFSEVPREISAVYFLKPVEPEAHVVCSPCKGIEKFARMRYATEIDLDLKMKENFEYLGKMVKCIPAFEVAIPWKLERLNDVYEKILEHQVTIRRK